MKPLTADQVAAATGATLLRAARWLPHLTAAMHRHGIDTPARAAHFLAQISVESGRLERLEENLNYSAERLMVVWPSRFKTHAEAARFAHNPQALANRVYGGRLGNTGPDDGWRYRGRGLKQLTGKANYQAYSEASGLDCVSDPDKLLEPGIAADSAAWFWASHGCSALADAGDVRGLTMRINGGLTGLGERAAMAAAALRALA